MSPVHAVFPGLERVSLREVFQHHGLLQNFVEPVPVHRGFKDHASVGPALHQRGEVMRRVMLDAAFAEVAACGVNRMPDAVFFVVVDADEGGGLGDDGRLGVG